MCVLCSSKYTELNFCVCGGGGGIMWLCIEGFKCLILYESFFFP
jgi:hypothetical protein